MTHYKTEPAVTAWESSPIGGLDSDSPNKNERKRKINMTVVERGSNMRGSFERRQ